MCTASWICEADGFELFFNRDEQRSRPSALPPRPETIDGVRALLPLDGQEHGTWIGANEHGLVACLLNLYEASYTPAAPRSRGHLVRELLGAADLDEVKARVEGDDLPRYRGFTLLAFQPSGGTTGGDRAALRWDGSDLSIRRGGDVVAPVVSSGFDLVGVRASRLAAWNELVGDAPSLVSLAAFHASRGHDDGAYDVSMSRPDACTVSHTRVRVTSDSVRMQYVEGAPADAGARHELVLPRRPHSTP